MGHAACPLRRALVVTQVQNLGAQDLVGGIFDGIRQASNRRTRRYILVYMQMDEGSRSP